MLRGPTPVPQTRGLRRRRTRSAEYDRRLAGRFADRVALVTGGANGLGRAIAGAFLDEGARVGILDLAEATAFAGRDDVHGIVGDVADPAVAAGAVAEVGERVRRRRGRGHTPGAGPGG